MIEAASRISIKKNNGFMNVSRKTEMKKHVGYWYESGDIVWGKVKSLPWWPGQMLDEALVEAVPSVGETKKEGYVLVSFFGDDSFRWLNPTDLVPFDSNYIENMKQSNAKAFLKAVKEAEHEVRQRAALGISCCCRNSSNFRETDFKGFLAVDVEGYLHDEIYSIRQIENARHGFRPTRVLCFLQLLAMSPLGDEQCGIDWMKDVAVALAYRKAVFKEFDETWNQAFYGGTRQIEDEEAPFLASSSHCPELHSSIRETTNSMWDVSSLHSCPVKQSFSRPSVHEKESALALVDLDHIRMTKARAVPGSLTPEVACLQNKNSTSNSLTAPLVPGHAARGATLTREPQFEKISAANCDDADNLNVINKALLLPNVSGGVVLAITESTYKEPRLSCCFLQSEKDLVVEKRKMREEMESERTCQENRHKHLRSTKEEASQASKDGKSSQTTLPASPSVSPELPLFIKEAKNSSGNVPSLSPSMHEKEAGYDITDARPLACSLIPEVACLQSESRKFLAITEGSKKKLGLLQCVLQSEEVLGVEKRKTREEIETCQEDVHKHLRSTKEEAFQVSRDGKF